MVMTKLDEATRPVSRGRELLADLGYPSQEANDLPTSSKRFPDGANYRIEIPSVEGPRALEAVIEEADRRGVVVHRVSSGTGIGLTTDSEIREMVEMCFKRQIELSLFVGPRAAWDASVQSLTPGGGAVGARHEGVDQLSYALDDLVRANELGVRGALVADEGLLLLAREMKRTGLIDPNFVVKGSVQLMATNPVSVKLLQDLGADTYNVAPGISLPRLTSIRQAVEIPLDMYIESPDSLGGFVRHHEISEMVRTLSPIYVKFGLRNHPDVYPSGTHLDNVNIGLAKERVRRAEIGMSFLNQSPHAPVMSLPGAAGLGVPVL